jgi:type VII secretion protein EccE
LTVPDLVAAARAGRFGAAQIVAAELAVMAILAAAYTRSLLIAVAGALATLVLLTAALGRVGGRWWYEAFAAWLRLRHRRRAGSRAARGVRTAGPYAVELAALAPYLHVQTATYRDMPMGVAADELGWFAAVAVTGRDGLSRGEGAALRLDWLARLVGEPAAPTSAVQVVVRQAGLPSGDPRLPHARSYQELRDSLGVVPHRDVWIAVRLDLDDGETAAADRGGDIAGIHRALGAALVRVSTVLTTSGLDHRVLDGNELRQALLDAYGPDPVDGRPARAAHETWSRWQARRTVHVCYAVAGWPVKPGADVLTELARVPGAVSVCTAIAFGELPTRGDRPHGPIGARMVLRVVAAPEAVGGCLRQLRAGARRLGVRLVRLDGEQAAAVYATTPTAAALGPTLW